MKNNRLALTKAAGITAIALAMIFVFCMYITKEPPGIAIGDYRITAGDNVYSEGTQTGFIELTIYNKGSSFSKLFYTSEDVLHNGFDFIVDDEYMLKVSQGKQSFKCRAYETGYSRGTQRLKLYYINTAGTLKDTPVNVQVVKPGTKETAGELPVAPRVEKECIATRYFPLENNLTISSTGIKFPNSPAYNQPFMTSSTLYIESKNNTYLLAMADDVPNKKVKGKELLKPKLKYSGEYYEGYKIFAVELEDWEEVEKIKIGDYEEYFIKGAAQKADKTVYYEDKTEGILSMELRE